MVFDYWMGPAANATQGGPDCCHCFYCRGVPAPELEVTISGIRATTSNGGCGLACEDLNGDYVLAFKRRRMAGARHFQIANVRGMQYCWWEYKFNPVCARGGAANWVGFTHLIFQFVRSPHPTAGGIPSNYVARLMIWMPNSAGENAYTPENLGGEERMVLPATARQGQGYFLCFGKSINRGYWPCWPQRDLVLRTREAYNAGLRRTPIYEQLNGGDFFCNPHDATVIVHRPE